MTRQWSKFSAWSGNEDQWKENAEYVDEDLSYLLELKAPEFWNIINDFHCNELLDSCLVGLPRSSDEANAYPQCLEPMLDRLYRRTFLVFLRLSTHKEKPFGSPEEFGKFIYDNYLISLPQIFDLCNLFSRGNKSLLKDMLENIFKHQPNYLKNDLPIAIDLMSQMMWKEMDDDQALDTFRTIYNFISVYPKGARIFYEQGFHLRASEFYAQSLHKKSNHIAKLARHCLINTIRLILEIQFLQPDSRNASTFHEYQDLLLHFVSEENFIVDYDTRFPVSEDVKLFTSSNLPDLDLQGIEYVLKGISIGRESLTERIINKSAQPTTSSSSSKSTILMVKETLPELGEGFILKCLEYYEDDPGKVINAIFEENLPPHLVELDRSLALEVNGRDEDKSNKKVVKKKTVLDDHSFMEDENMKTFYSVRGLVSDVVIHGDDEGEGNDYDDEYDDTYDDHGYGLEEPDAHEERRAFVLPRALGGGHVGKVLREEGDEESDEEEEEGKKKPLDFCRNPQEVREEKERKRQAKYRRGGDRSFGNVVGNAKGQGQDKSVLLNRARKNANKNKGQRIGADRKMAKGMF